MESLYLILLMIDSVVITLMIAKDLKNKKA
jgi:hypothetical protein